jgi:hypothetical protein
MKGKNLNIFVRFGGLDLKNQKGYGNDTFHSPPCTRGFYAMPLVAQELFLIGSIDTYQPGIMPKEPHKKKDYVDTEEVWNNHSKKRKKILSSMRKQFIKTEGNIWHHLAKWTDRNEIIAEHGSWCKSSIKSWQKSFSRMSLEHRYGEKWNGDSTKNINNVRGLLGWYSKDHCEVFFDEKV